MGNFRGRDDRRGGFDRNRFDRGGNRGGDRQMYKAVCSNCGKDCEVPFKPTNTKPVYCSDCFEKMGNGGRDKGFDRGPRFGRDRREDRRSDGGSNVLLESLNTKLDKIIRLLENQSSEKIAVIKPMEKEEPALVEKTSEASETPKAKKSSKKSEK